MKYSPIALSTASIFSPPWDISSRYATLIKKKDQDAIKNPTKNTFQRVTILHLR